MTCFVGIDLTSSPQRPSALAVLSDEQRILCLKKVRTDDELLAEVAAQDPTFVAIDAPLGLPKGLCCLEESCSCKQVSPNKGKAGERALSRMGIPCYYTTKRSIIRRMVYRGIALREALTYRGYSVLEVYPYGSKVQLFGKPFPRKTTPEGLRFVEERLRAVLQFTGSEPRLDHDLCDALSAALTAYLHSKGKTLLLGDADEGLICLPQPDIALAERFVVI